VRRALILTKDVRRYLRFDGKSGCSPPNPTVSFWFKASCASVTLESNKVDSAGIAPTTRALGERCSGLLSYEPEVVPRERVALSRQVPKTCMLSITSAGH
jgi:hypothetical protein